MADLTPEEKQDLRKAFDLTQDSGVVDQYGAKQMLQIFNMNPTTEDVQQRYLQHNKDASAGLTYEEFETVFGDYLGQRSNVQDALSQTLAALFEGPVKKDELRKILVEMGSEPFEPEEADEIVGQIEFNEDGVISQEGLQDFLRNRVDMTLAMPHLPKHTHPQRPKSSAASKPEVISSSPDAKSAPSAEAASVHLEAEAVHE